MTLTEKEIKQEIKIRQLVIKKIENPYIRLKKQAEKQLEKRKEKVENMFEQYSDIHEAREAYGWGEMTEDELIEICEAFEKGKDEIINNLSDEECAVKILGDFIHRLRREIAGFEFEMLPEEEKIKRIENQEKIRERLKK